MCSSGEPVTVSKDSGAAKRKRCTCTRVLIGIIIVLIIMLCAMLCTGLLKLPSQSGFDRHRQPLLSSLSWLGHETAEYLWRGKLDDPHAGAPGSCGWKPYAYNLEKPQNETPHTHNGKPLQKPFVSDQALLTFLYNGVTADATACNIVGSYVINALNGSAMDAAVSAVLCIGAVNFQSAGIGGGSFLMYYDKKSGNVTTFNNRDVAPGNATPDMFNELPENASTIGGLAIGVPGEIKGLALAHSRFGRLPWKTLVTIVVQLLRNGQRVTQALADAILKVSKTLPSHPPYDILSRWMLNPATGNPYVAGDILKDEKLAATMERIAEDPFTFYNGSLAQDILKELTAAGSIITAKDLEDYQPRVSDSVTVSLRNSRLRLHSLPPPSSGAVVLFILNVLDGYKIDKGVKNDPNSYVTFLHRLVEAFKFGAAKRSALGDPAFANVSSIVESLLSNAYADEIRANITDNATHNVSYYGPSFEWRSESGTSHLSLVDSDGNAVAVTSSLNFFFGSRVMGSVTGICYNSNMDDFSVPNRTNYFGLKPSPSNFIEPGKRPMSSMSPVFVTDMNNNLLVITGAAGGSSITSVIASTLARQIFLQENVKESTDVFRLHHQLVPNQIQHYHNYTDKIPKKILTGLKQRGHEINTTTAKSVIQTLARLNTENWQAVGDYLKPSIPSGY